MGFHERVAPSWYFQKFQPLVFCPTMLMAVDSSC